MYSWRIILLRGYEWCIQRRRIVYSKSFRTIFIVVDSCHSFFGTVSKFRSLLDTCQWPANRHPPPNKKYQRDPSWKLGCKAIELVERFNAENRARPIQDAWSWRFASKGSLFCKHQLFVSSGKIGLGGDKTIFSKGKDVGMLLNRTFTPKSELENIRLWFLVGRRPD